MNQLFWNSTFCDADKCGFSVYAIGCKCFLLGAVVIVLFVLVYLGLVFLCLGSFIAELYVIFLCILVDPTRMQEFECLL